MESFLEADVQSGLVLGPLSPGPLIVLGGGGLKFLGHGTCPACGILSEEVVSVVDEPKTEGESCPPDLESKVPILTGLTLLNHQTLVSMTKLV